MGELTVVKEFEGDFAERNQFKCEYDIYTDRVEVYDNVWGKETFDHVVFAELSQLDALRRLQTVEQLTLPDRYKTIPDSTHFSRWEHAWGSAIFAKKMGLEMGCDPDTVVKMQLKALLSDVCHTAHSHAGDWLFQGVGKAENLHDSRRLAYAEVVGISDILKRRGFDPSEILIEQNDGIINAKMPDLDVDRIDYTLREAYRWVNQIPEFKEILNKDSFTVRDSKIVVKDKRAAKLLGISYVLLVTEHWQEPAHRLQLELFMESIKRVLVSRHGNSDEAGTYSPLDLMMVTDDTLQRLAGEHDDFMPMLDELMRGVSQSETQNRWNSRADRIRAALVTGIGEKNEPIEWIASRYNALPRSYEITPAKGSHLRSGRYAHVLSLKKLRPRGIIPSYISSTDGTVKSLAQDQAFMDYMEKAAEAVQQDWKAAIIGNEASTRALKECVKTNRESWDKVKARPGMPNSVFNRQLRETVRTSNAAAAAFISLTVHPRR